MILISGIKITSYESITRITFCTFENGVSKPIYLEIDSEYEKYVVSDRIDGIVVGLLNYAMRFNHDIVSDLPISTDLWFQLTSILIPTLYKSNPTLHSISIKAPTIDQPFTGKYVGTGISCGVDSLYALWTAQKATLTSYRVTHLVYNNVGQHGLGEHAQSLFNQRLIAVKNFAKEFDFKLVTCNTNFQDYYPQNHLYSHTYTNLFPILSLANLFKVYYYASSGIVYDEISVSSHDPGSYEPILLPLLSHSGLNIYSGGANTLRNEKLESLVNYIPANKYLNVCVAEAHNCGKCEKCRRTIIGLYALGGLERFKAVFDLDYFYKHKSEYLAFAYYMYLNGGHDYIPLYPLLKKEIGLGIRCKIVAKILFEKCIQLLYPIKKKLLPNIHFYKQS